MTTDARLNLQSLKSKLQAEIIVLEQSLGVMEARTVTLPLTSAFDAVNRLLRYPLPMRNEEDFAGPESRRRLSNYPNPYGDGTATRAEAEAKPKPPRTLCERCDMPLEYGQACPDCNPQEGAA